jgi:hypothetical protein
MSRIVEYLSIIDFVFISFIHFVMDCVVIRAESTGPGRAIRNKSMTSGSVNRTVQTSHYRCVVTITSHGVSQWNWLLMEKSINTPIPTDPTDDYVFGNSLRRSEISHC